MTLVWLLIGYFIFGAIMVAISITICKKSMRQEEKRVRTKIDWRLDVTTDWREVISFIIAYVLWPFSAIELLNRAIKEQE